MTRVILFLAFLIPFLSNAQTCCSAGTPILSSLEISSVSENQLQFSYSYSRNVIKDVLNRTSEIEGIRQRFATSNLLSISYGYNKRWSFSSILSFIEHRRELLSPNSLGSLEKLNTTGIGDFMFMAHYNLIVNNIVDQREFSIATGVKIPTGSSTLNNNGILLPADIQSGTGSWDGVALVSFSQGFMPDYNGTFFTNLSYRLNGTNDRFQTGDGYKFGDVFSIKTGMSNRIYTWMDATLQFIYRNRQKDIFNRNRVANTGGEWVYLNMAINLNNDPVGMRISGEIPVYRSLNGIQLTTTYVYSLSIYYTFVWGE